MISVVSEENGILRVTCLIPSVGISPVVCACRVLSLSLLQALLVALVAPLRAVLLEGLEDVTTLPLLVRMSLVLVLGLTYSKNSFICVVVKLITTAQSAFVDDWQGFLEGAVSMEDFDDV